MKKILTIILLILSTNLVYGQMVIHQNLNGSDIERILIENISVKPKEHKLSEANLEINKINIQEFLLTDFDKEIALLAKSQPLTDVINFSRRIIDLLETDQNIIFIPENNIFLNLYKKAVDEEVELVTDLLRMYLLKCEDIYYINWLYSFNLLSKYDNKSNLQSLLKVRLDKVSDDQLFEVIYFSIPFLNSEQLNEKLNLIETEILKPIPKINLLYQIVKNSNLTEVQENRILKIIESINPTDIYFDSKVAIETIKKKLIPKHEIPENLFYSFSNNEIIDFLRTDLKKEIPKYCEHLIDVKFVGNYFRKNEAILSWVLKYYNNSSSYYSNPENIVLLNNKFYHDIFKPILTGLDITSTSYILNESNDSEIRLKTLIGRNQYVFKIITDNEFSYGTQIVKHLNEILRIEKKNVTIHQIDFKYPLYIVDTESNFQKLETKFKLKRKTIANSR